MVSSICSGSSHPLREEIIPRTVLVIKDSVKDVKGMCLPLTCKRIFLGVGAAEEISSPGGQPGPSVH